MRIGSFTWKLRASIFQSLPSESPSGSQSFMAECVSRCMCCGSRNKVDPRLSSTPGDRQCTEVEIDREGQENGPSSWTVPGIFSSIFHASPDNKLAVKLYGSKKELLLQKKTHETGSNKWMIHPYSHFRYKSYKTIKSISWLYVDGFLSLQVVLGYHCRSSSRLHSNCSSNQHCILQWKSDRGRVVDHQYCYRRLVHHWRRYKFSDWHCFSG